MKTKKKTHWLKLGLTRAAKIHFLIVIAYIGQIIAYDASRLITPEQLMKRWFAAGGLLAVSAIIWYLARSKVNKTNTLKLMSWILIASDIAFAAFNVYQQRGMSSRAVLLFLIPILVSGILLSRVALFSTAILCIAAYTSACVAYFVNYFNEGYKVELYGEILFYSFVFLVSAMLLWAVFRTKHPS